MFIVALSIAFVAALIVLLTLYSILQKSKARLQKITARFIASEFELHSKTYAAEYGVYEPLVELAEDKRSAVISIFNRFANEEKGERLLSLTISIYNQQETVKFCGDTVVGKHLSSWELNMYYPIKSTVYEQMGEYLIPNDYIIPVPQHEVAATA